MEPVTQTGRQLFDKFPMKNGLEKRDVLLPLLFNFALDYAIRRIHVNQNGLKLNGTYQSLVYADDFNMFGGSVHTTKKNTEDLVVSSKESGWKYLLIKLNTWPCLEITMQKEVTSYRFIIVHLKGWNSSNIWEQPKLIKILITKKLRAD